MSRRDLQAAQAALGQAQKLVQNSDDSALKDQVARVESLLHYLKQFWNAVRQALRELDGGDQIRVGTTVVGVVEVGPDHIVIRQAGRNRTFALQSLPSVLALALAENWLNKQDPVSYLVLGAFCAVDSQLGRDRARSYWQLAAQMGLAQEVQHLLPELEQQNLSAKTDKVASGSLKKGSQGRWKLPSQPVLRRTMQQLRQRFASQLQQAQSPSQCKQLCAQLQDAAQASSDPLERFGLMLLAAEVIAWVDFEQVRTICKNLSAQYEVERLELMAKLWHQAALRPLDKEGVYRVVESGWDLADELALEGKDQLALGVLRQAVNLARKAKLRSLAQETAQRLRDLRELIAP